MKFASNIEMKLELKQNVYFYGLSGSKIVRLSDLAPVKITLDEPVK